MNPTNIPDFATLVILGLACWRISNLLMYEEGPFNLIFKLRSAIGVIDAYGDDESTWTVFISKLMSCMFCFSIWVGLLISLGFGFGLITGLAISSISIAFEKYLSP
tara:strand:- start:17016 stop:17333 length:318 start_codon:yes stop_codon:yes gene_type:complete